MLSLDLIILFVYLISVTYVLYQAWLYLWSSLEDVTVVKVEREMFDCQLEENKLVGIVDAKFGFGGPYKFDQPQDVVIVLENKSQNVSIEVDWDRSSLTDVGGRSRRVIRLTPDKRLNLYDRQVFSMVAPGKILREKITAEDVLKLNAEKGTLEPASPLFTIPLKDNINFLTSKAPLRISLRLALRLFDLSSPSGNAQYYALACDFSMWKVPKSDLLPWKK